MNIDLTPSDCITITCPAYVAWVIAVIMIIIITILAIWYVNEKSWM